MARHTLAIPPREDEDAAQREFLNRTLCMEAVSRLEVMFATGDERFPAAVDTMWALLNDDTEDVTEKFHKDGSTAYRSAKPRVAPELKVKIIAAMTDLMALKKRSAEEAGVGKVPKSVVNNNTLNMGPSHSLTYEEMQSLPEEIQRKLEGDLISVRDAEDAA